MWFMCISIFTSISLSVSVIMMKLKLRIINIKTWNIIKYEYSVLDYNITLNRYNIGGVFIGWSISGENIELQNWIIKLSYLFTGTLK